MMPTANATTRLLYVMDPMCSWCWGFAPVIARLVELAADYGVDTEIRVGGLRQEYQPLSPDKRRYILQHWQTVAATTKQPFNFAQGLGPDFIYDTEPACRALLAAQQLDQANNTAQRWHYLKTLQTAFYCQAQTLTEAVLIQLAQHCGYPTAEFATLFTSDCLKQRTEQQFAWVKQLPASGFPSVFISHQQQLLLLTNGYQPAEQLAPQLRAWLMAHA
ncbi:DsbA family protein [Thiopseudomonas alkaliphila]|uniref:DsbA family protein n=1 Tax=Thiopseudomonas alkaliphila TaxID=1697053 RepID=UPI0025750EFF|nr:DsbA family protein [Thiopseudomonas alkaliphila]